MNKLMITAAAVALLAGETAASAQTGYTTGGQWRQNAGGSQTGQQGQGQQGRGQRGSGQQGSGQQGSGQQGSGQQGSGQGGQSQGQAQGQARSQPQSQGSPDYAAYYKNNPDLQRAYERNKAAEQARGESPTAFAERHYREHGQAEGRALPRSAVVAQPFQQQTQPTRQQGGGYTGQSNDRGGRSGPDFGQRGDQGPNRNWQDYNRRYGEQNQSARRQNDHVWDGHSWRPEQFSRRDYYRNRNAERRFRLTPYFRPNGWYAERWTYGQILPFIFFTQNYWIDSYWDYGLPIPPYGCEWVRYGDDALMVDVETGEILQVVYGIFY